MKTISHRTAGMAMTIGSGPWGQSSCMYKEWKNKIKNRPPAPSFHWPETRNTHLFFCLALVLYYFVRCRQNAREKYNQTTRPLRCANSGKERVRVVRLNILLAFWLVSNIDLIILESYSGMIPHFSNILPGFLLCWYVLISMLLPSLLQCVLHKSHPCRKGISSTKLVLARYHYLVPNQSSLLVYDVLSKTHASWISAASRNFFCRAPSWSHEQAGWEFLAVWFCIVIIFVLSNSSHFHS